MDDLKLTILTPTYNRAHTLQRAFDSLKNQTFKKFCWIILDDGSTDDTEEIVNSFISENNFPIEYFKNENSKKFYTVFKGIEKVKTDYFAILDSDDAYPADALKILVEVADELDRRQFISVIGHSEDENGKIYGTQFPGNGFDGSVLEMRYKYKIRGDKNGLFITEPYLKYLRAFDFEFYKGKYAPQKIFFSIYDGDGMKTRFINQVIRTYYFDADDQDSMSNDRVKPSSYIGLRDGYRSFLNSYGTKLGSYPKVLLTNLVGFQSYSILTNQSFVTTIHSIQPMMIWIAGLLLYPLSYVYTKLKNK